MNGFSRFISASREAIAGVTGICPSKDITITIHNTGPTGEDSEYISTPVLQAKMFAENILKLCAGNSYAST